MQQYLELLREIKRSGTYKPAAREGMPGTQSLFGYQFRHDLSKGFPLLTTKKMFFRGIVTELLWFLRGDTNIKYLVDRSVNIWNEDAYNYYVKIASKNTGSEANHIYYDNKDQTLRMFKFDEFVEIIKQHTYADLKSIYSWEKYTLGDCGYQYGKIWRSWKVIDINPIYEYCDVPLRDSWETTMKSVDQISNLVNQLRKSPESRRHILTAIDPGHDNDLALYWCHALVQFNCRPMTRDERREWIKNNTIFGEIPKYFLDCQLYQRSADSFLGVPFNIASYALLTHILARMCNMVPGEFIHTFGDVHIYENHQEAVEEQLSRIPSELPTLKLIEDINWEKFDIDEILQHLELSLSLGIELEGYNPQKAIKAELSTGLKK